MKTPYRTNSGNPGADRRADYAEMLSREGDHSAAAEVMMGALEIAPDWALGWFRLGEFHAAAGVMPAAAQAWRMALKIDPDDHAGASLNLALCGAEDAAGTMPSAFVETLFDQYADKFDTSLIGRLGYRVPQLLFDALLATGKAPFAHAVDLGCGTGLMGERLRPVAAFLEGCDLSEGMLAKARAKGVYDLLVRSDIHDLRPGTSRADLVVAADVFMYLGRLDRVFSSAAALLAPDGLFAFSVERHDGAEPFRLGQARRYAHSEAYLRSELSTAGFELVSRARATIRQDRNQPVDGLIIVAAQRSYPGDSIAPAIA